MPLPVVDKKELRRGFLARRAAIGPEERRRADAAICERIRRLECYRNAACVAMYAGDGEEPDLAGLFGEKGKRFFLPRYAAERKEYELVEVRDLERELTQGKFGLLEPRPELPAASAETVAREMVFLTPAVACDRHGVRLGRGGGFYDRMLAGAEQAVVAVVYGCQMTGDLPRETHDRLVDFAVTEEDSYEFFKTKAESGGPAAIGKGINQ